MKEGGKSQTGSFVEMFGWVGAGCQVPVRMRGERRPSVGTRPDKPGEASVPGVEGRSDGVCTVRCLYCSLHIDWSPGHVRRRLPGPGGSCAARRAGHCSGRGDSGQAVGAPSPVSENIWLSGPRPD